MYKPWSLEEEEFIKLNAGVLTDQQLKNALNKAFGTRRKTCGVRKHRQRLGIKKINGRNKCGLAPKEE